MIESILFMIGSHHVNDQVGRLNGRNPGAIIVTDNGTMIGRYQNSFNKPTNLLGRQFKITEVGPVKLGVGAAVVSGYPIPILASGYVQTEYFQVFVVPPVKNLGPLTVGLALRIPF